MLFNGRPSEVAVGSTFQRTEAQMEERERAWSSSAWFSIQQEHKGQVIHLNKELIPALRRLQSQTSLAPPSNTSRLLFPTFAKIDIRSRSGFIPENQTG